MSRITDKQLQALCDRINTLKGTPMVSYRQNNEGKYKACIGNYHVSGAYGGVSLHQMVNEGGGIRNVFSVGYVPKRQLYELMHAYIKGLEDAKELV